MGLGPWSIMIAGVCSIAFWYKKRTPQLTLLYLWAVSAFVLFSLTPSRFERFTLYAYPASILLLLFLAFQARKTVKYIFIMGFICLFAWNLHLRNQIVFQQHFKIDRISNVSVREEITPASFAHFLSPLLVNHSRVCFFSDSRRYKLVGEHIIFLLKLVNPNISYSLYDENFFTRKDLIALKRCINGDSVFLYRTEGETDWPDQKSVRKVTEKHLDQLLLDERETHINQENVRNIVKLRSTKRLWGVWRIKENEFPTSAKVYVYY